MQNLDKVEDKNTVRNIFQKILLSSIQVYRWLISQHCVPYPVLTFTEPKILHRRKTPTRWQKENKSEYKRKPQRHDVKPYKIPPLRAAAVPRWEVPVYTALKAAPFTSRHDRCVIYSSFLESGNIVSKKGGGASSNQHGEATGRQAAWAKPRGWGETMNSLRTEMFAHSALCKQVYWSPNSPSYKCEKRLFLFTNHASTMLSGD